MGKVIVKMAADTLNASRSDSAASRPTFLPDADFESAIDGALFGVFVNQGEVCSAGSRIWSNENLF